MYSFVEIEHSLFMPDFVVAKDSCRKESSIPVASPSDCVALTGSIQRVFKGYSFDKVINSPMFPKGCFALLHNGTHSLLDYSKGYFNFHVSGSILKTAALICKNPKGM